MGNDSGKQSGKAARGPKWTVQTPCGASPAKAAGVIIEDTVTHSGRLVETVSKGMQMRYEFPKGKMVRTGLKAPGPSVWVIRALTEVEKEHAKKAGLDLRIGQVYGWETHGEFVIFPWNAWHQLTYLCDFDQNMSNDDLMKLFLKPSPETTDEQGKRIAALSEPERRAIAKCHARV